VAALATERLILRPVAREDIARIAALAGDVRVAEATRSIPHPLGLEQVAEWFDGLAVRSEQAFALVLKGESAEPALMGIIALTIAADGKAASLGYWLGVEYWGQGYMSEAARRLVRYAVGDLKLGSVDAEAFVGNERSVGVLIKAGFDVEGRATRPAPARGGDREVLLFRATRASFARAALSQAVGRE
jgi:RimJ/RimL family protein N-acetyltransferase